MMQLGSDQLCFFLLIGRGENLELGFEAIQIVRICIWTRFQSQVLQAPDTQQNYVKVL